MKALFFFHVVATERYRLNTITSLETEEGRSVYEHSEKASLLLEEYNHRMGSTTNPTMLFDLTQLVQTGDSLDEMSRPFSIEDIDSVIKQMAADKAPGPDGFNGFFLKSCWEIVKKDFYNLCFDFFNGYLDLQSINNSHITLIPKTNHPTTTINDQTLYVFNNYELKLISSKSEFGFGPIIELILCS
jgi:hypothetical protein